ncbi:MAG TPA: hypothetical protein VLJ80_07390 [Solirubrobacteraceae bacterium]|nr:hypothetical protein [Solirubrobacteraceae bacterium]
MLEFVDKHLRAMDEDLRALREGTLPTATAGEWLRRIVQNSQRRVDIVLASETAPNGWLAALISAPVGRGVAARICLCPPTRVPEHTAKTLRRLSEAGWCIHELDKEPTEGFAVTDSQTTLYWGANGTMQLIFDKKSASRYREQFERFMADA